MYKNVLIISDNLFLCKKIEAIILKYKQAEFSFSISPFSDLKSFQEEIAAPVHVFNLKNIEDIEKIIASYDLILSIHCKQLFPISLISRIKSINIHPGYNPYNRGWYPQVFSILNDEIIGATIHEIDEEIDHGAIIDRLLVKKDNTDTSGSLYDKILEKEIELFEKNIQSILNNSYSVIQPENEGKLYLKKDFNDLCKLDLKETGTFETFIKKMRALTHKNFNNAYYIDPETKEKIYISLKISK